MKTRVVHVSVWRTAATLGVIYLIVAIPLSIVAALPYVAAGADAMDWVMLLSDAVLSSLTGFLVIALAAWLYNRMAPRFGGIEFTARLVRKD